MAADQDECVCSPEIEIYQVTRYILVMQRINKILVYGIPLLVVGWILYIHHLSGPFSLSRIDPEYAYLKNGLNCALGEFERIGHHDHPGTPFQLLTGLFIWIVYAFTGQGTLTEDVIGHPEKYLTGASLLLTFLTALVILWLGRIVYHANKKDTAGILLMQLSLFLNVVVLSLPSRYNPDRMLSVYSLILAGLVFQYICKPGYPGKKFAIFSGLLLGVAVATKINYLPLVLIPFLVLEKVRDRFYHVLGVLVAGFIGVLPILDKLVFFRDFMFKIATHDGLYGSGSGQVLNVDSFLLNLKLIFQANTGFFMILFAAVLVLVFVLTNASRRKAHKKESLFFIAFVLVSLIEYMLVAKHYKQYYMAPVLSLSGIALYLTYSVLSKQARSRYLMVAFGIGLFALVFFSFKSYFNLHAQGVERRSLYRQMQMFARDQCAGDSYYLLEPTWRCGLFKEDGLAYGLSYTRYKNEYMREYEQWYPDVIIFRHEDRPLLHFTHYPANNQSILKSGRNIYLYSTPQRRTGRILQYIEREAGKYNVDLRLDTVYRQEERHKYILRYRHADEWNTLKQVSSGFEITEEGSMLSDDGLMKLQGVYDRSRENVYNGLHSVMLDSTCRRSPGYLITDVLRGDYFEVTLKAFGLREGSRFGLVISSPEPQKDSVYIMTGQSLSRAGNGWELIRLCTRISSQPVDSTVVIFFNHHDKGTVFLDDFSVSQYREGPAAVRED